MLLRDQISAIPSYCENTCFYSWGPCSLADISGNINLFRKIYAYQCIWSTSPLNTRVHEATTAQENG